VQEGKTQRTQKEKMQRGATPRTKEKTKEKTRRKPKSQKEMMKKKAN